MISRYYTNKAPKLNHQYAVNDSQGVKVYRLEREIVGGAVNARLTRGQLQELSNHVCRYYGIPPAKIVVFTNRKVRIFGDSTMFMIDGRVAGAKIRLNVAFHGANIFTLLHELAHYIVEWIYDDAENHGPQFVGIYMHLLDKYKVIPSCAFRAMAKKHRIKIAGKFRPVTIR